MTDPGANRNPYKGIRKQRKAQWVYDCSLCGITTAPRTDLFGAVEAKRQHINGRQHTAAMLNAMGAAWEKAFTDLGKAFTAMVEPITNAVNAISQIDFALAPSPNVPHDPSLRADKRKWGGR